MPQNPDFYIPVFNYVHFQLSKVKPYKASSSGGLKQLQKFLDLH